MSTVQAKKYQEFLNEDAVKELLKEYVGKLADLCDRAHALIRQIRQRKGGLAVHEFRAGSDEELLGLWKAMRPAAVNLAQYASATIEHARIDQITDIELRLRLAEFEHHLHCMDSVVEKMKETGKK